MIGLKTFNTGPISSIILKHFIKVRRKKIMDQLDLFNI